MKQIEIELSDEEHKLLERVADYYGTTPVRTAEWYVKEQATKLQKCREGGTVWLGLVEYLRQIGEGSPKLEVIERYIAACATGYRNCKTTEDCRMMDVHFKSLVSWLELIGEID